MVDDDEIAVLEPEDFIIAAVAVDGGFAVADDESFIVGGTEDIGFGVAALDVIDAAEVSRADGRIELNIDGLVEAAEVETGVCKADVIICRAERGIVNVAVLDENFGFDIGVNAVFEP